VGDDTTAAVTPVLGAVTAAIFSLDLFRLLGNVAYLSRDLAMSYVLTNFLTVEIFDCLAAVFKSVFFPSVRGGLFRFVSKWKDDDMLLGSLGGRSATAAAADADVDATADRRQVGVDGL